MSLNKNVYITPDWPVQAHVKAMSTLRYGAGVSVAPYDSFNLGDHVGDDPLSVQKNRSLLTLPAEPVWLKQTHSTIVVDAAKTNPSGIEADASITQQANVVCVVMTADCLPLLVSNRAGTEVAAIHAGWRGLVAGVIENTLGYMKSPVDELLVWLGPGIGADAYEVGDNVRDAFIGHSSQAESAFGPLAKGKWLADMYQLARQRLQTLGLDNIYGGGLCTYSDAERFYSYRRDGVTGRMASLIWIEDLD